MTESYRRLSDFQALPGNAKDHDLGAIMRSIITFGLLDPVVWNTDTGHTLSGHGRVDALVAMYRDRIPPPRGVIIAADGMWLIPDFPTTLAPHLEPAAAIALNRTVQLGGWDAALLTSTLTGIAQQDPELLEITGFTAEDLSVFTAQELGAFDTPDALPDAAPHTATASFGVRVTCQSSSERDRCVALLRQNGFNPQTPGAP